MKKMLSNKFILTTLTIITVATCGFLVSCSTAYQHESTGQYIDSSVLTTKVKAKLLADKQTQRLPITVKTYKNDVQLSGFVTSASLKERAEMLARSVPGVTHVENSLIIKSN